MHFLCFVRFPSDARRVQLWLAFVASCGIDPASVDLRSANICSGHFDPISDYSHNSVRRFLTRTAVPTVSYFHCITAGSIIQRSVICSGYSDRCRNKTSRFSIGRKEDFYGIIYYCCCVVRWFRNCSKLNCLFFSRYKHFCLYTVGFWIVGD